MSNRPFAVSRKTVAKFVFEYSESGYPSFSAIALKSSIS